MAAGNGAHGCVPRHRPSRIGPRRFRRSLCFWGAYEFANLSHQAQQTYAIAIDCLPGGQDYSFDLAFVPDPLRLTASIQPAGDVMISANETSKGALIFQVSTNLLRWENLATIPAGQARNIKFPATTTNTGQAHFFRAMEIP